MSKSIDTLDKELIRLLRRDGRMPGPRLSAALGISLPTVHRKIDRLINERVIQITAFIDPSKTGTKCASLYGVSASENLIPGIMPKLLRHAAVTRISRTTGRFNLTATLVFQQISEMSLFHLKEMPNIEGINYFESMLYLFPEVSENHQLKELDYKIFEQLREDGRVSSAEIAGRLGFSGDVVRNRINRLISRNGIISVRAIVNPARVDWFYPVVIGIYAKQQNVASIISTLSGEAPVRHIVPTLGRYNIILYRQFESETDMFDYVDNKIRAVDGVLNCEVLREKEITYGNSYFRLRRQAGKAG